MDRLGKVGKTAGSCRALLLTFPVKVSLGIFGQPVLPKSVRDFFKS